MPNLCVSTLMLVTPGTAKSKGGTVWPSLRANGSTKPPRHASEWQHTPARCATWVNTGELCLSGSRPSPYGRSTRGGQLAKRPAVHVKPEASRQQESSWILPILPKNNAAPGSLPFLLQT